MVLQHKDSSTLPKNTSESIPLIECDWGDVFKGKKSAKAAERQTAPSIITAMVGLRNVLAPLAQRGFKTR